MKTGSIYKWWKSRIFSVGLKIFFFWRLNFLYRISPQWNEGGEKVQLSNCQNIAGPSKPKTCNVCHLLCTFTNWEARNIMSIYFVDSTNAIRSYENFLSIISRFMTFIILSQTFYLVYTHFHMLKFKYIQKCDTEIVINCTRGLEKFSYILQRCPYILFYRQRYVMGEILWKWKSASNWEYRSSLVR